MLRLVFTVCMIASPDVCEQRELHVWEKISTTSCVMGAMPDLAAWNEMRPGWRIARWHCEAGGGAAGAVPTRATPRGQGAALTD